MRNAAAAFITNLLKEYFVSLFLIFSIIYNAFYTKLQIIKMKCTIPEISWHNKEPVLSVDIFPEIGQSYRVASAGADSHVLIWQMNIVRTGAVVQELVSDLTKHQRAVNCVRWSTTGRYLASADDDGNIVIWQLKTDNIPLLEGDTGDKEIWNVFKIMRHNDDVYDICWSIDETKIVSGSIDNTAVIWDVGKGQRDHIMSDHKGFVQGVAWDPKNQFIATISTDRICRLFDASGKHVKARIQKGKLASVPEGHFLKNQEAKYFHDDTFKSFFRRLQFTPDGSLLIVPSGHIEVENCKPVNATLIFTLDNLISPSIILPIPVQSSTVVRVSPVLYKLREDGPDPVIILPYRMVFAVGTDHDIILYDTQQPLPFARFQDIHYTRLTDLTWSLNGLLLIASSTDGFCSLITFEEDEIGVPWTAMECETKENVLEISGLEELDKDENVDTNNKDVEKVEDVRLETKKRTSFLEQWALKTPKKIKIGENDEKTIKSDIEMLESPVKDAQKIGVDKPAETINKLIPRRKTQNSEEQINILVPKRIKPTFIEPVASTSKIHDSHNEEITISDSDEGSSESEKQLSQKEQEEYDKAARKIKQFFSKEPLRLENNRQIDSTQTKEKVNLLVPRRIKPICVEPKAVEPSTEMPPKNDENKPSDAKSIAIRTKARKMEKTSLVKNSMANKDSGAKLVAETSSKVNSNESKSVESLPNRHSDLNLIEVEKKVIEPKINKDKEKSKDNRLIEKSSQKTASPEKPNLKLTPSKQKVDVKPDAVINLVSDEEEIITTPKKPKTLKPTSTKKVTPSGKQKTTPRKQTSTLLNFLQKAENSPKTNKEKKVDKVEAVVKETCDNKVIPRLPVELPAEACDQEQEAKLSKASEESSDIKKSLEKKNTVTEMNLVESKQEEISDPKKVESKQEEIDDSKKNSGESKQEKTAHTNENVVQSTQGTPRAPRRVPIITLSSPSGKIKRKI